jgi:murein L,D-transpeptidase YcbB/YkuD
MLFRTFVRLAAALALAAASPSAVHAQEPVPATAAPAVAPVASPLSEAIRERIDHLRYDSQHDVRGARIVLDAPVAQYYESQGFRPAWQDTARLDALIAAVADLVDDGLDPADYHYDSLQSYRLDARMKTPMNNEERADLELLATDAFMLALYHCYLGKVDPIELSTQWNFSERPLSPQSALARVSEVLAAGQIREAFERARPQHPWYRLGRERLREYRAIAAAGGWPGIPDGPVLKPGMSDPRVPVLRRRLQVTHDLPETPMPGAAAGSTPAAGSVTAGAGELYDPALETAVRAFQQRHGVTADGVIGQGTRAAMNVPVEARIDQLRVNLERGRWTLHEIKGEFVLVDVAGFDVSYFRDDQPIWTSKVVVGRDERETPIFRSTIQYVVLNPTWTIPPGILVKDKLPQLRRNPGALRRMNIRVIDGSGREIDPYSIDWNRYASGRLPPYQFRQDAGPNNALGLVKIMFPNPYLVYLHDSPAKELYEQDQRTFSSGCIRVQKPLELAALVLNDPQWNAQSIDAVIANKQTRTINLKKPLPVLILYWTAQPRPDGQVIFRNDVYGRDASTLAALNRGYRVPADAHRPTSAAPEPAQEVAGSEGEQRR